MPSAPAMAAAVRPLSPVSMTERTPSASSSAHRRGGVRARLVAQRDQADRPRRRRNDRGDGLALASSAAIRAAAAASSDAALLGVARRADEDRPRLGRALHAPAGQHARAGHRHAARRRAPRPRARIASASGCEEPVSTPAASASTAGLVPAERDDVGDLGPADGQRAGLVEGDASVRADRLEHRAALHQQPAPRARPTAPRRSPPAPRSPARRGSRSAAAPAPR